MRRWHTKRLKTGGQAMDRKIKIQTSVVKRMIKEVAAYEKVGGFSHYYWHQYSFHLYADSPT